MLVAEGIPSVDILPKPYQYLEILDDEEERIAQLVKQTSH
jgi:hypothetical protein